MDLSAILSRHVSSSFWSRFWFTELESWLQIPTIDTRRLYVHVYKWTFFLGRYQYCVVFDCMFSAPLIFLFCKLLSVKSYSKFIRKLSLFKFSLAIISYCALLILSLKRFGFIVLFNSLFAVLDRCYLYLCASYC